MNESQEISCNDCVRYQSEHCSDCLVTFICDRQPGDALVIDASEAIAVRMLSRAGLVSDLKYVHRAG
jgi:hypothetical protein